MLTVSQTVSQSSKPQNHTDNMTYEYKNVVGITYVLVEINNLIIVFNQVIALLIVVVV
jgi:uncharacterized membrane protein YkgB